MPVTPVQFGATGTDNDALFLKQYTGSFVSAPRSGVFLFNGVAEQYIFKKRPGSGKSWQFLMMSEVPDAEEFEPGDDLLGQVFAVEEGTIVSDKYIVCHKWIGKDKMDQSHFEILPQLAQRHRSRIERLYDRRAMITAALGARSAAVTKSGLNIHNGGNRVTRSGSTFATAYPLNATGAANLRADLRSLSLALDRDNIAPGPQNRAILLEPYLRSVLTFDATGQVFSRDYVTTSDQMRHEVEVLERFTVLGYPNSTSNNGPLPDQNITDGPVKYQGNFSAQASDGLVGVLAFCRSMDGEFGLGSVEFESLRHVVLYFPERLAWLVMTYMRSGMDRMHPWCLGDVEVII